jgi:bacteriocin biosynthesis cyclodehydratase domain-containing protein
MPDMVASLPGKPKLRPCFDVIFMEGRRCQIRAGDDVVIMLEGRTVSDVLPMLFRNMNGALTVAELADACEAFVSFDDLVTILTKLNEEGILEDGNNGVSFIKSEELDQYSSQLKFFGHFDKSKFVLQERLKCSKVGVIGSGSIGTAVLSSLARMGIGQLVGVETAPGLSTEAALSNPDTDGGIATKRVLTSLININPYVNVSAARINYSDKTAVTSAIGGCDVIAVAIDNIAFTIYEQVHNASLTEGIPWIVCSPLNSIEGIVGPFFVPGETCCYRCYQHRIQSNLTRHAEYIAFESYVKDREGRTAEYGYLGPFPMIIGNLLALEIVKHLTGFASPETYGRLITLNFLTLRMQHHEVFKLPRCPDCSPSKDLPPKSLWSR